MDPARTASTGFGVSNLILRSGRFSGLPGRRAYFTTSLEQAERMRAVLRPPAGDHSLATELLREENKGGDKVALGVPAGLMPVIRLLEGMGADRRPAGDPLADTCYRQRTATPARFIVSHQHGLIRYHSGRVDPARLILEIVRQFPDAQITILAARRADAIRLARLLRRHGVNAYGYVGSGTPYFNDQPLAARVAVATVAGLAGNPTELEKQDLILCLDAVEASGRATREVLLDHTTLSTKLFGLVPMGEPPAGADADWVRALFGFDVLDVLVAGLPTRTVQVRTVAAGGRRLARAAASSLELRRYGIWNNETRNRQVARIARTIVSRDVQEVRRLGVGSTYLPSPGRVVVTAENLEHALRLLSKLDGWALVAGLYLHTAGLGDEERRLLAERLQIDPVHAPGLVVTPAGLTATTGFAHIKPILGWSTVIRADAGDGLPFVPDEELAGTTDPLLVVDLTDDHHPALEAFVAERRRSYVEVGGKWMALIPLGPTWWSSSAGGPTCSPAGWRGADEHLPA